MKRRTLLCFLAALVFLSEVLSPFSAFSASYEEQLKKKGFSEGYISALTALHLKYPKWEFKVFDTGLDWKDAVAGERKTHRNQIIEKSSAYGDAYYCDCSSCKPNGVYKYQYSGCVSASEWAVEYFMDPRNWLDEKHIFQFSSNAYSESETQSGVEAIIKSTWMSKANITYLDTEGNSQTYKTSAGKTLKYSKAIMLAAKESGMSAYYLASRIVKEVGSSKPTATGVCGDKLPFTGMYNYYSIGASSGGMSGLEYASGYLRSEEATTLYDDYDETAKAVKGKKTAVAKYQYMSLISEHGDYYKVRLYSQSAYASGKVGYVPKAALRTTYFNYGRPWNNPYKSIVGGASFIAAGYLKYQYTSYLEKFNVNKASGSLYSHEYMQNVNAVSSEAESKYKAYDSAGLLSSEHTFYIPVFKNMPSDTSKPTVSTASTVPEGLRVTAKTAKAIRISWTAVANAEKYYILVKNLKTNKTFSKTVTSESAKLGGLTAGNRYRIRVRAYVGGSWGKYSSAVSAKAVPMRVTLTSLKAKSKHRLSVSWNSVKGISGYQIKYARDSSFKKTVATKNISAKQTSCVGKNFTKGKTYYVKVRAYKKIGSKTYYGAWSKVKKVKCK